MKKQSHSFKNLMKLAESVIVHKNKKVYFQLLEPVYPPAS